MHSYHVVEWFLFFYIYCFLGWVWECCYVSVLEKKWVNRGFLHGPFLPIYGSGAVIVLVATIPVREQLLLVFLFGMAAATLLEYVTGEAMERMFHVRYWDYSKQFLNVNGHICLMASVGWGFFSVFMVQFLHRLVEYLVFLPPFQLREMLALVLSMTVAADATRSFQEAMDLKEVLIRWTAENEELKKLQKRLDVLAAVIDDETKGMRSKVTEGKEALEEMLLLGEKRREEWSRDRQERTAQKKASKKEVMGAALERTSTAGSGAVQIISEKVHGYMEQVNRIMEERDRNRAAAESEKIEHQREEAERLEWEKNSGEVKAAFDLEKIKRELEGVMGKVKSIPDYLDRRKSKEYSHSMKILKRNPSAKSKEYQEALEEIRRLEKK